jgi:hypothetical protein
MEHFDPDGPGPIASIALDTNTPGDQKGFAVVYDSSWAVQQTVIWETAAGDDGIYDIMATPDGGFAVCGTVEGDMPGYTNPDPNKLIREGYIQKYDASGTMVWDYQTQTAYYDYYGDMSLDEDGNIYVSGTSDEGLGNGNDPTLTKFDPNTGAIVWHKVIDGGGTYEYAVDGHSLDKTSVYVLSEHRTDGPGGTWANTLTYTPQGTDENLLQKLIPGDFDLDGDVDFDDVQTCGSTAAPGLPGTDTYDFDEDGDSDLDDAYFMITECIDRRLGDISTAADTQSDVDSADIGLAAGNYTGAGGSGKTYIEGDMNFDGDIDSADLGLIAGEFTGDLAGNLVDTPDTADLIYDPATGNMKISSAEAAGNKITVFQLECNGGFAEENYQGVSGGTFGLPTLYEDVSDTVLADADLTGIGFTGVHDFGNVLPVGLTLEELEAFLTNAVYTGEFGSGQKTLDLTLIPEPATLALLGLGGLFIVRRRRK